MPASKSKAAKTQGVRAAAAPTRAGATTSAGDGPTDDSRRTPVPAPAPTTTHPKAKKKTADGAPTNPAAATDPAADAVPSANSAPEGVTANGATSEGTASEGTASKGLASEGPASGNAASEDAAPDEDAPANPLEALRRAQARRVPPPGTQPRFAGGGGRGSNPSAPRHYNRHK